MGYVPEKSREDRKKNIAIATVELSQSPKKGVSTDRLRKHIRDTLKLPALTGEDHLGDLRAHGDAVGGHGLKLDVKRQKVNGETKRVVHFTEENLAKCKAYLADGESDILV